MSPGLVILITAFVVAVLGFFASNLAEAGDRGLFGLSRLGTAMVIVAAIGLVAGVWKEIVDTREGALAKEQSRVLQQQMSQNAEDLKLIKAKLDGLAGVPGVSPQLAEDLKTLSDRVSAVASSAREADLRASDFSRSHFGQGNFTEASFEGALIVTAWLKDAVITNSNLEGVDFAGSRFAGAKFGDAILDGADFRGADLSGVLVDSGTILPN